MNVVGYVRVSTDAQAGEDRFGIAAQKAQIGMWCDREGHTILDWYIDEGRSGASEDRPEFDKLIYTEEVRNPPVEAVVVAKSDRVARDIQIYYYYKHELLRKGMKLISVSEDFGALGAMSELLESFILTMAKMERENINKRTTGGRLAKARMGGYAGGKAPYGYSVKDRELTVNEEEAEAVRLIFRCKGLMSLRKIAEKLNEGEFRTRSGKPWSFSTVQGIIENEGVYRGEYKYSGLEVVHGRHEAILKEE